MATGNFINSEYGIFVLPTLSTEEAEENLKEAGIEVTPEAVEQEIRFYEEITSQDFTSELKLALSEQGVTMYEKRHYIECYDAADKILARLELSPGYYSGCQVLVDGDPQELLGDYYDEEDYLEEYSPDIESVLTALRAITVEYQVYARFSNGETWYQKR